MSVVVNGTSGPDLLSDNQGDTLIGLAGDDTYVISNPAEIIVEQANGGNDTVKVWCGGYTLAANIENLVVQGNQLFGFGNELSNVITVQGSGDVVAGMGGNDTLVDVGAGQSIFSFSRFSGSDIIKGFNVTKATHDFIQLTDYGFTSFDQVKGSLTQVGSDVMLQLDANNSVTLKGVSLGALNADDFLLQTPGKLGRLTFSDDFNSLSLYNSTNTSGTWKTNYWFGTQFGINEWGSRTVGGAEQVLFVDASYKGSSSSALGLNPFSIDNGVVSLTVAKAPAADVSYLHGQQYTAGLLTTEKTFAQTYGYFEIRAQTPGGQGLWPSFWLLPTDDSASEIDILEQVNDGYTHESTHGVNSAVASTSTATYFKGQGDGQFHTYGLLWTPQTLTFYIDGVAVVRETTPSDLNKPMYLIVSMGGGGSWPGQLPADFTSASLKVDYVHAYALPTGETDSLGPNGQLTKHFAGLEGLSHSTYDQVYDASGNLLSTVYYDDAVSVGTTTTFSQVQTYTGKTKISGELDLAAGGAIASSSQVALKASGAVFDVSGASAGGAVTIQELTGVAGSTIKLGAGVLSLTETTAATYAGAITDGGIAGGTGGGLVVNGTAPLTLSGADTFTGKTQIYGQLDLAGSAVLNQSKAVTLKASGAVFDISQATGREAILNLAGVAGSHIDLGANTLKINDSTSATFSGVISDGGAAGGAGGALIVKGTASLNLTGANTFTGGVTLQSGVLELGTTTAAGAGGHALTFAGAATLQLDAGALTAVSATKSTYGTAIAGFASGDFIDLSSLNYNASATATYNGATLKVTSDGAVVTLMLTGLPATDTFSVSNDGLGHVLVGLVGG